MTYADLVERYWHRQSEPYFNLTPIDLSAYVAACATGGLSGDWRKAQAVMVRAAYRGQLRLFGVPVRVRPLVAS